MLRLAAHQIVQGQVCDGISEDALLYEQHVAPTGLDLLDQAEDVVPLFLVHPVHLQHTNNTR